MIRALDLTHCRHCLLEGHWADNCPLLIPPATRAEHFARLDEFKRRFLDEGLPVHDKTRMITTENALWKAQKENAK